MQNVICLETEGTGLEQQLHKIFNICETSTVIIPILQMRTQSLSVIK